MIPPEIISRLQIAADPSLRPVTPVRDATDRLAGLAVGQRVLAEILAQLPNGSYRALINQRDVILALPFSAKSGDAIELVVTQSNGKQAFAVALPQDAGPTTNASTATVLSRTGQFISNLFVEGKEAQQGKADALPLNNNQAILTAPPTQAQHIIPQLKAAIGQSGMFYESHQAAWLAGKLPQEALLREPQGKLSLLVSVLTQLVAKEANLANSANPANPAPTAPPSNAPTNADASVKPESVSTILKDLAATLLKDSATPLPKADVPANLANALLTEDGQALKKGAEAVVRQMLAQSTSAGAGSGQIVAPQTQSIVQQQLSALASQHFAWQGQIWPGQDMRWEIEERREEPHEGSGENGDDEVATNWQTRLYLKLPQLGGIDARISIQGEQIALQIFTDNNQSLVRMRQDSERLRQQFTEAGLSLSTVGIAYAVEASAGAEVKAQAAAADEGDE